MLNIPIEDALSELAESIAESLALGDEVTVAGFGHFEVRHVATHVETHDGGRSILQPPHDIVIYRAMNNEDY